MRRALLVIVGLSIALAVPASASAATGLVAAYSMDAGSGTALADVSGTGNDGTISGATWAPAGKFGSALSFNGGGNIVTVPDTASLDLATGMTEEAWVQPATLAGNWRTVLFKEGSAGGMVYDLYANGTASANRPTAEINIGGDKTVAGTAMLATGVWTHIAATYDGANLRFYVNGVLVGTKAQTGAIPASTGPLWHRPQHGLQRALRRPDRRGPGLQPRAQRHRDPDRHERAGRRPGHEPPTAPSNLSVTGSLTSGQLSWTGSTDNVGVAKYDVYRSTTPGFTPSAANRIAQPTGTTFTDTTAATNPGTYYYRVAAEDGNGNISAPSNEASATIGDTIPPTAPGTLTATGAIGKATLTGAPPPTTSASRATTSTAARRPASRLRRATGSPSRRGPATPTRRAPGPTSTRSPPRTPPATSDPSRTRRTRRSRPTRRRPRRPPGWARASPAARST